MARKVWLEFDETHKALRVLGQRRRILPGRRQKTPRSNCVLDVSKLLAAGVPLRPVLDALEHSLKTWKPDDRGQRTEDGWPMTG